MGQACVITVDNKLKEKISKMFEGKSRNEISEMNVLTESEIHYIPDISRITEKENYLRNLNMKSKKEKK